MRTAFGLLTALVLVACQAPGPSGGETLRITALAGPTCPVVSDPPDPNCDDRPVDGAEIVVRDASGREVARIRTDDTGAASVALAPGRYVLEPQAVDGLMGTASPVEVAVEDGVPPEAVILSYDTGIR